MRTVALLVLLTACAFPPDVARPPLHQALLDGTRQGWEEAGLPPVGRTLHRARIEWARDELDFIRRCRWHPAHAAACRTQESYQVGLRVYSAVVLVLRPGQPLWDTTGSVVVHELLHALHGELLKTYGDPWHQDARVWFAAGGEESAQGRARAILLERPPAELVETLD